MLIRSLSPEYYLIVGYLAATVLLLESSTKYYDDIWVWFKYIAIFEAFGVYLQWITPEIYYSLVSIVLPKEVVVSIGNRLVEGYYTGFTREVSYTVFLIIVGLGIYIFLEDKKKKKYDYVIIAFLFGSLLVSGKLAPFLFFILSFLITLFIRSKDKLKIIKCLFLVLILIAGILLAYPLWSQIPVLSKFAKIINYLSLRDMTRVTNGRTVIYNDAIQLWKSNIWFGIGWGNFKYSIMSDRWYSGFDVHNCFLQVFCETGIIGGFLYIFLVLMSIVNICKLINYLSKRNNEKVSHLALFCGFIQIFFILYSLTEPILYEYTDYMIFFCSFSTTACLLREFRYDRKTSKKVTLKV